MGDIIKRPLGDGTIAYYARYLELDGRRVARATKARTEKEAIEFLHAAEARVRRGEVGIVKWTKELRAKQTQERERAAMTLAKLAETFCDEYASPKVKNITRYRRDARSLLRKRILPTLGERPAQSIKAADVEGLRDALALHAAPASVICTLAQLSKVYSWARKKGMVACENPVKGVERPSVQSSIDYLSHEEVGKLLLHAEQHAPDLHPMIATAIYTGARKGELFGLLWRHAHLEQHRIDIERSYKETPKSGKKRHVPINPELEILLRKWRDDCPKTKDGLVFPVGNGRMGAREETWGLGELLEAAGCHVPSKPWHALRHTFASHFMMAGGNILTLQKLLGHSDLSMTMVYAHLAPDFMAAEVARMSFAPKVASMADLTEERRKRAMDTERETWQDQADNVTGPAKQGAEDHSENATPARVAGIKQGVSAESPAEAPVKRTK